MAWKEWEGEVESKRVKEKYNHTSVKCSRKCNSDEYYSPLFTHSSIVAFLDMPACLPRRRLLVVMAIKRKGSLCRRHAEQWADEIENRSMAFLQ